MDKIKIEYIKTSELKPYGNNPRINDNAVDFVAESIKQFGFTQPIIIDEDKVIVCGHTRLKAALKLGIEQLPCIQRKDLSEEQIKAFRLADNKVSELATWDLPKLDIELDDIEDIDMSKLGFDLDLSLPVVEGETQEDNFDENEIDIPKRVKRGDIWQLGEHRLMCGDSVSATDIHKLTTGGHIDITFTSPPYNAGKTPTEKRGKTSKYENDSDNKTESEYAKFLADFTKNVLSCCEYVFVNLQSLANNKAAIIHYMNELIENYADTIIWDKMQAQPAMAKNVLNSEFEYIHIFSHKANRSIGCKEFRGTLSNILHMGIQRQNEFAKIHNATFSIEFASFFIENFSNTTVLDPFCGSGTTLIACEQLNRKCYAMELDPHYCDVIIKRWEDFTNKKAIKLS